MKRKILSLALALALCLGLAVPAFAATLTGSELHGEWGSGPSLTLNGVTAQRETPMLELAVCYDVAVGGSMVLDMPFPAGHNRVYGFLMAGVYDVSGSDDDGTYSWDISPEKMAHTFEEKDGKSQYVYNFTQDEVGQLNGHDKLIYMHVSWDDDLNGDGQCEDSGVVYFYIRVVPAQDAASKFADVPAGQYYAEPVAWAVENGITNGTSETTFSPDATCTQAQILTFLWRAQGEPAPKEPVGSTLFYAPAAQWADDLGLIDLLSTFSADADCTRAMVVTYLWKLAGSPNVGSSNFTDVPASADYAQAVAWAVQQGITNGISDTSFAPDATCTRGQIVTFLYRAFAD